MDIKKQIAFCKSIDAETNEKGQYIYESTNKASKISLPYILLEYEQWLRASKNPVPPTSNCTIPVVSSSLPKNVRQLKGMCCAFFRYCGMLRVITQNKDLMSGILSGIIYKKLLCNEVISCLANDARNLNL